MNNQTSMFDRDDPIEIKMWHKLAMNLLYALPSKNIVKNYRENRVNMPSAAEPVTPVPARSVAGSTKSRQSTFHAKSSIDNNNSHGSINNGNNSPDSQQKSEMKRATSRKSRSIVSVFMKDKKPDVRSIL